ncbi:MAG: trans-aconitate 2-methyltransferase [Salinigranum sp.]
MNDRNADRPDDPGDRPDGSDDRPDGPGDRRSAWDPDLYDDSHAFVAAYGADLLDLLAPESGERVLDVGCGTGHLTARVAASGAMAVGIDASPEMIRRARDAYSDPLFVLSDVRDLAVDEPFDAVLSNAALHWIPRDDQPRAIDRIAAALRPGGRFVAELGGAGNVEAIETALREELASRGHAYESQWYFPSLGEYASLLEDRGFEVTFARLFDRPTPLDGGDDGLRNWLSMFAASLLDPLDEGDRAAVVDAVEDRLRPSLYGRGDDGESAVDSEGRAVAADDGGGSWVADYRRLRFVARRP